MIDYEDATRNVVGYEPQQENLDKHSTSFSFSLQILMHEGLAVKGDMTMQKTSTVPPRASAKPVTSDIEQEYDDVTSFASMPRSAIRFRSTQSTQPTRTTGPITVATPTTSNRVSGTTRALLWVVLVLCIAFLVNGIVIPAITNMANQFKYGTAQIATYDLNGKHFLTEEDNGHMRIIVSNPDGSHYQELTTIISGAPAHALVSLTPDGSKLDVSINGAYIALLVPDNHGGYVWGSN